MPDSAEATRAALGEALEAADVVVVSGGVSVGPHDHVKDALAALGAQERFWGISLRPGKPVWFGTREGAGAAEALAFGLPGNPVSAMVTFQLFVRPALAALQGADPSATRTTALLERPIPRNGRREQAVRVRLTAGERRWHGLAHQGRAGVARAHLDARRRRARADRPRRRRGTRGRAGGGRAAVRRRDPRRVLERRQRARARVNIVPLPRTRCGPDGSIGSRQVAEVTLPRSELDRIWSPEYLERLARTYWRFLTRVSLGLLRVLYTDSSREVVLLTRPFVLLRFKTPEYDFAADRGTVTWPIDRGLLVARKRRGRGYLRLSVERQPDDGGAGGDGDRHLGGRQLLSRRSPRGLAASSTTRPSCAST